MQYAASKQSSPLSSPTSGPATAQFVWWVFRPRLLSSLIGSAHISLLLFRAFAPGLSDNFARNGLSDKPTKHLQSSLCRPPNALRMLRTVDGGEYICCSDNDIDPAPEVDVWQICKLKLLSSRSIHYVCIIDHCSDCPRNGYSREISEAGDKWFEGCVLSCWNRGESRWGGCAMDGHNGVVFCIFFLRGQRSKVITDYFRAHN